MPEFCEIMKKFEHAFIKEVPESSVRIYYKYCENLDSDAFIEAVEEIILKEKWFPSISTIINYSKVTNPEWD